MKQAVLMGAFVGMLGLGVAYAQAAPGSQRARGASGGKTAQPAGHAAPKPQPASAPSPSAPTGEVQLGSVRLAKPVKTDGKSLAPGTYQLRLTAQNATPDAKGESQGLERWVEFMQRGQVKGREVASIVPQAEIAQVQKDAPPRANSSKVETLKGGDYVRVWVNKGGNHYLIHLPAA